MSLEKAQKEFKSGEFENAVKLLEEHLKGSPYDIEAHYHLALSYRRLNDHIKSLQILDTCVEMFPDHIDFLSERGVGKFHLNDKQGALDDMNLCVSKDPKNPYRYSCRAYIRSNMNDVNGALEDYSKAVELDPEDSIALNNLGMLEEKAGKIAAAKKTFDKTDKLINRDPEANQNRYIEEYLKENPKSKITIKPDENNENIEVSVDKKKLTATTYFSTVKYIFGSKEGLKEFFSFLTWWK